MITLGVGDLNRSIDFYQNGLGFPRHGEGEKVAFFSPNGTWLGLYGRNALADDAQVDSSGTGFNAFAIAHNVSSEKDVDEVVNQAVNAGPSS